MSALSWLKCKFNKLNVYDITWEDWKLNNAIHHSLITISMVISIKILKKKKTYFHVSHVIEDHATSTL